MIIPLNYNYNYDIIPLSTEESIPRVRTTNFIEKSNNIYDIKCASYENIFYDKSNDTNLIL
jgi:hypothetical protein